MPKKPKCDEGEDKYSWSEDQKEREYYYDDAHGYESYEPEEEDDEGDEGADLVNQKERGLAPAL